MTYELHQLCTLFPRLSGAEFEALRTDINAINASRSDGLAVATFSRSDGHDGSWDFDICDVTSGMHSKSRRPIAGEGVALVLREFANGRTWDVTFDTAKREAWPMQRGCVYAIQAVSGGAVKIGWTAGGVERRLRELQCGNPCELFVVRTIEPASQADERALHQRLAEFRIRGEWFSPAVLGLLGELR